MRERTSSLSPVTSSHLVLSAVASKRCLFEHAKFLPPAHVHTSPSEALIHSPLNSEVWQWLSVVADVSSSADSSDSSRVWRIRLAQQVPCQSHPSHLISPSTSHAGLQPRNPSSVVKDMAFNTLTVIYPLRMCYRINKPEFVNTDQTNESHSEGQGKKKLLYGHVF